MATITYRKAKTGEWVAFGPVAELAAGQGVMIAKKDGGRDYAYLAKVGRSFAVDGVEMAYGYIDRNRPITHYDADDRRVVKVARTNAKTPWWDSPRERALAARDGDPGAWS